MKMNSKTQRNPSVVNSNSSDNQNEKRKGMEMFDTKTITLKFKL